MTQTSTSTETSANKSAEAKPKQSGALSHLLVLVFQLAVWAALAVPVALVALVAVGWTGLYLACTLTPSKAFSISVVVLVAYGLVASFGTASVTGDASSAALYEGLAILCVFARVSLLALGVNVKQHNSSCVAVSVKCVLLTALVSMGFVEVIVLGVTSSPPSKSLGFVICGAFLSLWLFLIEVEWWHGTSPGRLKDSESNVISIFLQSSSHMVSSSVVAGLGTLAIHNLNQGSSTKPSLVLVHGWMGSNIFWAGNIERLSERFRVYCVELPGCGISRRFPWTINDPQECLSFFAQSLERWRIEMRFEEPFVLLGHSLGSNLAAAYAVAYPQNVSRLYLVSPAGVNYPPDQLRFKLFASPTESSLSIRDEHPEEEADEKNLKPPRMSPMMFKLSSYLWEAGFTPNDIIRWAGPIARFVLFVSKESIRKGIVEKEGPPEAFYKIAAADKSKFDVFINHLYHSLCSKGSGEYALQALLFPGAHAKIPLLSWLRGKNGPLYDALVADDSSATTACSAADSEDDSNNLTQEGNVEHHEGLLPELIRGKGRLHCPVHFIYGCHAMEMMNPDFGMKLCEKLIRQGTPSTHHIIEGCGHKLMLQDPLAFERIIYETAGL